MEQGTGPRGRGAPDPGSPESRAFLARVAGLALFVVVFAWAVVIVQSVHEEHDALRHAEIELSNLTRAFTEHTAKTLEEADQAIRFVRSEYTAHPSTFDLAKYTQSGEFISSEFHLVTIVGADGYVTQSTQPFGRVDLREREHFRVHQESHDDFLFVSKPVLGKVSKLWSIQLTRRINLPDGRFGGVVVLSLSPDYLTRFYREVDVGSDGVIELLGMDGMVRAREPDSGALASGRAFGTRILQAAQSQNSGVLHVTSAVDSVERVMAWRALPQYRLVVATGESVEDILATVQSDRLVYVGIAALLTLAVAGFSAGLWRSARRQAHLVARLRESEERYRQSFETNTAIKLIIDRESMRIVKANEAAARFYGYPLDRLQSMKISEINSMAPEDLRREMDAAAAEERPYFQFRHRLASGEMRDVEVYSGPATLDGRMYLFSIVHDITARKRAQAELDQTNERLQLALRAAGQSLFDLDIAEGVVYLDEQWNRILGGAAGASVVTTVELARLTHPDDLPRVRSVALDTFKGVVPAMHCEFRVRAHDGQWKWIACVGKVVARDAAGRALRAIGTNVDVSERKHSEEALQIAASVFEASSDGIVVTDGETRIVAVNRAFTAVTGYGAEEALGRNPRMLQSGRQNATFYEAMWRSIEQTGQWQGEIWNRRKNGEVFAERMSINTLFDTNGKVSRRICIFSDITEQKRTEDLIWRQANYDGLTGLPNRRLFRERLRLELAQCRRSGRRLALLFIDLDRFKDVNDTLGHDVGDRLLEESARRITSAVRETDAVARLGGDEFTVVLPDLDDNAGVEGAVEKLIERLAEPFQLGEQTVYISASIGVTFFPDDAADIETLLKNADHAMYAAKEAGRNRFNYFTSQMQHNAWQRLQLGTDLRHALELGQFEVYYQPIIELASGRITKVEALLRWHHPRLGMVEPGLFIPLAEDLGLIGEIGDWVFRLAARTVRRWTQMAADLGAGDAGLQICINKSPRQFLTGDTHERWPEFLAQIGLPADRVCVEITERLLLDVRPEVAQKLAQIRSGGMKIAIDDFGTGYSSMSYLKRFNIDTLKIDRAFVHDLSTRPDDRAIPEAIIAMARKLGMSVVAEGVETPLQRDLLLAAGCDFAQGYLFAAPMPVQRFEALLLKQWEAGAAAMESLATASS